MSGPVGTEANKLLSNVVSKLLSNNARFSGVEHRVLAPVGRGKPYIIELSKGRASRQVFVDVPAVQRLKISRQVDFGLIRELRIAILHVLRLSARTEKSGMPAV